MREIYKKIDGHDHLLFPCPFCGSPAELWEYDPSDEILVTKVVMCTKTSDENETPERIGCPLSEVGIVGFHKPTKREAIKAWNARTLRNTVLDSAIEIVLAEPETIQTSSSYRMGYARCARDKAELLEQLKQVE